MDFFPYPSRLSCLKRKKQLQLRKENFGGLPKNKKENFGVWTGKPTSGANNVSRCKDSLIIGYPTLTLTPTPLAKVCSWMQPRSPAFLAGTKKRHK